MIKIIYRFKVGERLREKQRKEWRDDVKEALSHKGLSIQENKRHVWDRVSWSDVVRVEHPISEDLESEIFLTADMMPQMENSITGTDFIYPESHGALTLCWCQFTNNYCHCQTLHYLVCFLLIVCSVMQRYC